MGKKLFDLFCFALLIAALALVGPGQVFAADKWDRVDMALMAANVATKVIDAHQTRQIRDHDDVVEADPIGRPLMGRNPGDRDVVLYFAAMTAIDAGVAHVLPSKWRKAYLTVRTVASVRVIHNNAQLGLDWRF